MSGVFEVSPAHISRLNSVQLTALLRRLLHLEAERHGLPTSGVHVPLRITVSDAGEDGRIQWSNGPRQTDWVPRRFTLFQVKATTLTPKQCADELIDKNGCMKANVQNVSKNKGAYIFFCGRDYNMKAIDARIQRAAQFLTAKLEKGAKSGLIDFYDANRIATWTNHYFAATVYVLGQLGHNLVSGLQTWEQWSGYPVYSRYQFEADEKLIGLLQQLRSFFLGHSTKKVARLVGLSGLGKTRLALEAFRPAPGAPGDPSGLALSDRVVYARHPDTDLVKQVIELRKRNCDGLLIVDDCDHSLHAQLSQEVKHSASRLSLLTLDFVADEKPDSTDPLLVLTQSGHDVIRGILKQCYRGLAEADLDRIVEFAQGFPQMAILLADARLQALPNMGSLNDKELVARLLWGHGQPNEEELRVVEACALFEVLGVGGTVIEQLKFVASEFCRVGFQTFYSCLVRFQEGGIIERRGDFVRVRPKPLAVRLAADWWRKCHPEEAKRLFRLDMPLGLDEALCSRMAMLEFLPEAREIAGELCGDAGPFGQAQVLNSERGSRCLCSIVEVNPAAALSALTRAFGSSSRDELLKLGPGRRGLVRSLEKLCCRRQTFDGAARLLLDFASAENERWANNATGTFLQLFSLYLSGTEVPAIDRLALLCQSLASDSEEAQRVSVEALARALDGGNFTRFHGVEFQGVGAPIEEWRPQDVLQVTQYWDSAESKLMDVASSGSPLAELAARKMINHIRAHIAIGRIDHVESWVARAVLPHGSLWSEALDQLQQASQYDRSRMSPGVGEKVEALIAKLQPRDLRSKITLLVSSPPSEHVRQDDGSFRCLDREKAEAFAQECAQRIEAFLPLVDLVLSGEQRQAFAFGSKLGCLAPEPSKLISAARETLKKLQRANANPSFLAGILHGLQTRDANAAQLALDDLAADEHLAEYMGRLTGSIRVSARDLVRLLGLLKNQKLRAAELAGLAYGQALRHLSVEELLPFLTELIAQGLEAATAAFEIAFFYVYPKKLGDSDLRGLIWEICFLPGILARVLSTGTHQADSFLEVAGQLVADASEENLGAKLIDEAIAICEGGNQPYSLIPSVKSLITTILHAHPRTAWNRIGQSVIQRDPLKTFRLQRLLGRGVEASESRLVSQVPIEFLRSWCHDYPGTGPQFLAGTLPPLQKTTSGLDWSPEIQMVLNEFGDQAGVLNQLAANMGTFSWVGSAAGYHESFLRPLEGLLSHRSKKVSKWANTQMGWHQKRIAEEKKREQERDFGIFR
jgi:hypothetical protein